MMQVRQRALAPVLMVLVSLGSLHAQPPERLALVGGMLLDGYEVPPLHHAAVLIEGNKILEVGRAAEMKIPSDAVVIDTSGRVMMPGLIDLHVHLIILGHGNYARWIPWLDGNDYSERAMVISVKQLLMAGITSAVVVIKDGVVYKGGPAKPAQVTDNRRKSSRNIGRARGLVRNFLGEEEI